MKKQNINSVVIQKEKCYDIEGDVDNNLMRTNN
jgi:hypothetical protein